MLRLTRKAAVLARVMPTFAFSCAENAARRKWKRVHSLVAQAELLKLKKSGQFPDEPVRRTV
jgi:hypothetical protein